MFLESFYTTSFKDSYKKPEVKPFAPYAENHSNQFSNYNNAMNKTKIEKENWFNSSKKNFSFNETNNQIINSFNNVSLNNNNLFNNKNF